MIAPFFPTNEGREGKRGKDFSSVGRQGEVDKRALPEANSCFYLRGKRASATLTPSVYKILREDSYWPSLGHVPIS